MEHACLWQLRNDWTLFNVAINSYFIVKWNKIWNRRIVLHMSFISFFHFLFLSHSLHLHFSCIHVLSLHLKYICLSVYTEFLCRLLKGTSLVFQNTTSMLSHFNNSKTLSDGFNEGIHYFLTSVFFCRYFAVHSPGTGLVIIIVIGIQNGGPARKWNVELQNIYLTKCWNKVFRLFVTKC